MTILPKSDLNLGQGISVIIDESGNYAVFYCQPPERYNRVDRFTRHAASNTGSGWLCSNQIFPNLIQVGQHLKSMNGIV